MFIKDFLSIYYGVNEKEAESIKTYNDFTNWKTVNRVEEWDYPLEEKSHIAEIEAEDNTISHILVQFTDIMRFCEVRGVII